MIRYQQETDLTPEEFISVLDRSTLGERRPVGELERINSMLKYANLVITARENGILIGVARSLTDFAFCTYMSDLAVDQAYQRRGIGKELIRHTKSLTPKAKLILLAAPKAVDYYPHIGMTRHEFCYILDRIEDIR